MSLDIFKVQISQAFAVINIFFIHDQLQFAPSKEYTSSHTETKDITKGTHKASLGT
jgi:hypothetical protein